MADGDRGRRRDRVGGRLASVTRRRRVRIRPARPTDARRIVELSVEFTRYIRRLKAKVEHRLTVERFLADGFGPNRAFSTLVALADRRLVGYVVFCPCYDVDRAERGLFVPDLYVESGTRRRGVGRTLMAAVAAEGRRIGGGHVVWSVWHRNAKAKAFYRAIGGRLAAGERLMTWRAKDWPKSKRSRFVANR
jgi:ribosomal protein S18 acetylase RimI-like enzyme